MDSFEIEMERDALRGAALALKEASETLETSAAELETLARESGTTLRLRRRCRRSARALRALGAEFETRRLLLLLSDQERAVEQGRAYQFARRLKDMGKKI